MEKLGFLIVDNVRKEKIKIIQQYQTEQEKYMNDKTLSYVLPILEYVISIKNFR